MTYFIEVEIGDYPHNKALLNTSDISTVTKRNDCAVITMKGGLRFVTATLYGTIRDLLDRAGEATQKP